MTARLARINGALPAVNLATLLATVAVLWWRIASVERQVEANTASIVALKVQVAGWRAALDPH